jgi:hypothetical protein
MEKEIKELRVKIDGLAQLTKSLKEEVVVLDLSTIPNNQAVEEWLENYKNGLIVKNSTNTFKKTSKEVEKAVDSLHLAKAWLGKILGELGTQNPYKSGYKTKEDIEPTADKGKAGLTGNLHLGNIILFKDKNHIEKVDWLRQEIEKLVSIIKTQFDVVGMSREFAIARTNTYNYLCEAKFWLGFELQMIKENG